MTVTFHKSEAEAVEVAERRADYTGEPQHVTTHPNYGFAVISDSAYLADHEYRYVGRFESTYDPA